LFESYLQRVEKLDFSIDTRRTLHGQVYEFKSKDAVVNLTDLQDAVSRFEHFMSLAQNDHKKAEALMLRAGIKPLEADRLVTKYLKEHQRLFLDIEHEQERRMLDIRQRLESEVFELTNATELTISPSVQPATLLSLSHTVEPITHIPQFQPERK
jgi:hypothetical protein